MVRTARALVLTSNKEIWGMALWVERHHGAKGHSYIDKRIETLGAAGETAGANLWRDVAERSAQLRLGPIPIHGQSESQLN